MRDVYGQPAHIVHTNNINNIILKEGPNEGPKEGPTTTTHRETEGRFRQRKPGAGPEGTGWA